VGVRAGLDTDRKNPLPQPGIELGYFKEDSATAHFACNSMVS